MIYVLIQLLCILKWWNLWNGEIFMYFKTISSCCVCPLYATTVGGSLLRVMFFYPILLYGTSYVLLVKSGVLIGWHGSRAGSYVSVFDRSGLRVSSAILLTKGQAFEKSSNFNEFSKLSIKSWMSRTMNNLKEVFTIIKAITTRKTTLRMMIVCHAICISKLCCLKCHMI